MQVILCSILWSDLDSHVCHNPVWTVFISCFLKDIQPSTRRFLKYPFFKINHRVNFCIVRAHKDNSSNQSGSKLENFGVSIRISSDI